MFILLFCVVLLLQFISAAQSSCEAFGASKCYARLRLLQLNKRDSEFISVCRQSESKITDWVGCFSDE